MNEPLSVAQHLTAEHFTGLYRITDEDIARVQHFGEAALPELDQHVDDFYVWLKQQPEFEQFFHDEQIYERIRGIQPSYWHALLKGRIDDDYMSERRTVGEVHARIGLPLPVYFAAMATMLELFTSTIGAMDLEHIERARTYRALTKLFQLDTSVVVETYTRITSEKIAHQSRSLMAMSTPVTEVWDGVLLLPIVGVIDSQRAQDIMSAMLTRISETASTVAILDVSGVAVVDTAVANHLIKVTKATRLMGCECTISGVSPAIAQTMVALGVEVGDVHTTSTLRDALANAFSVLGDIGVDLRAN